MWYKIDVVKFAMQLLPTMMRGRVLMALIKIMASPLSDLQERFISYKNIVSSRLNNTAQVQSIQKVLNDAFYLHHDEIFISTEEEERFIPLYYNDEKKDPKYVNMEVDSCSLRLRYKDEISVRENFVLNIPTSLCTSINPDEDAYSGTYLQTILNLLNYYIAAGRTYRIKLYDL